MGCKTGDTITYDHCKAPAEPEGPGWVVTSMLTEAASAAAARGDIAPLAGLKSMRIFAFRGLNDTVYLPGSVNKTVDFFAAFAQDAASQILFVTDVPIQHAVPSIDPAIPTSSCNGKTGPPAIANCGYDGAGALLQHLYGSSLTAPAEHSCGAACTANVLEFSQEAYFPAAWPSLSSLAYAYIPPACSGPAPAACRLHISLHGCGMSRWSAQMNMSYVYHAGFNPWAEANNIVVLYPQGGGYLQRNEVAPAPQMGAGCMDSYGQTGPDYAFKSGLQMSTVRNMIFALAGV
jgi:poly(3-hydroxybutyrate) depolymerase